MVNKLGFLGFLGLLGLLGLLGPGYYGFFGFCAYFYYFTVVPDELFCENVRRSASAAFFALLGAVAVGVAVVTLSGRREWAAMAFALAFAAAVVTFSLRMAYVELREAWSARICG